MRLSKFTKKGVAVALALSMVVVGNAGMTQKASAAKKLKTYVMFADEKWKVTANMDTANGKYDAPKTVTAKKGSQNVTMTLKRSAINGSKKIGINVLLGCEVTLTESPNDYLLYGADESFFFKHNFLYNLSIEELSELCHNEGILIIQAHPGRAYCEPVNPVLLDGAEVYNGNLRHDSNNDKTYAWAYEHDLIMTSGSDFHEKEDLAHGGIITEHEIKTEEQLIKTLLSGNYSLITPAE